MGNPGLLDGVNGEPEASKLYELKFIALFVGSTWMSSSVKGKYT